jgi:hypothetical protein
MSGGWLMTGAMDGAEFPGDSPAWLNLAAILGVATSDA